MAKRAPRKVLPARKSDRPPEEDSLLLQSAESLGRVIGSLQRQVRGTSNALATAARDAADALPELPRFDDVMENVESLFGNKRRSGGSRRSSKSAFAKVGSQRDPTSQRWSGGPPSGRTAAARPRQSSKSDGGASRARAKKRTRGAAAVSRRTTKARAGKQTRRSTKKR